MSRQSLSRHRREKHKLVIKPWACKDPECPYTSHQRIDMNRHMEVKHNITDKYPPVGKKSPSKKPAGKKWLGKDMWRREELIWCTFVILSNSPLRPSVSSKRFLSFFSRYILFSSKAFSVKTRLMSYLVHSIEGSQINGSQSKKE